MLFTGHPIQLSDLTQLIQHTLEDAFQEQRYSVIAETTGINLYPAKNQCYLTLIEKCAQTDRVVASIKGRIWGNCYGCIQNFEQITGQPFKDNIKLLLKVRVHYHAQYGLSLEIEEIDPNYTIGQLALSRLAVLEKLLRENPDHIVERDQEYFTYNKTLAFPPVIQRIALISSAQADGYADFMHELKNNRYGFTFEVDEYLSPVQGLEAHKEIYRQLVNIYKSGIIYDVVVLVRGGGSQIDFQAYDSYLLARAVARFHLPIITGIGHEKNESICDLMANLKTKTPTKAASTIVAHNQAFWEKLQQFQKQIVLKVNDILVNQELILNNFENTFINKTKDLLHQQFNKLNFCINATVLSAEKRLQHENIKLLKHSFNLQCCADNKLKEEQFKLRHITHTIQYLDPRNILKRGFSLVYHQGKIVKDAGTLPAGTIIKTKFSTGTIESIITEQNAAPNER